jgi:hypothetical protein
MIIGSLTIQIIGIATTTSALSFGMMVSEIFSAKNYEFDAPKPPLRKPNLKDLKITISCVVLIIILIVTNFSADEDRHSVGYVCISFANI